MMEQMFKRDPAEARADVKEAMQGVFSIENLRMKGLLTNAQAYHLSRGYAMVEVWKKKYPKSAALLENMCDMLMETSVSTKGKGGRGRDDLGRVLASLISVNMNDKNMMREENKIWGGLGR